MADTLQLILEKLEAIEQHQQDIQLEQRSLYRQVEALFALYQKIDFRAPLQHMLRLFMHLLSLSTSTGHRGNGMTRSNLSRFLI